ncbi:ferritin [Rhodococcus sp. BP-349]|jgi:ferritin|uniref:ferritin n=1 Tax=unclassified Rhodococcus (in: high G+C Gram-positive bacteria) TaxID=192944 RepID=UPI0009DE1741|nr:MULTISPECIES: ferritin [unclassified Rhodococcus (in: high G+C Gram-positive bacteria)]MBY6539103.1 ferritin [Rhodococcus sp. BP-363]MBY6544569.1 ferritin [Rhodococcus sp. BP-369]MBY6563799.1 ferritin [Rhodococcus sp. BP-370]MBY6578091.1 ferritin [Rhodococcus sp. BP-364]MBY6587392.1 ferritin [Rhodococcus sp. BP-358]
MSLDDVSAASDARDSGVFHDRESSAFHLLLREQVRHEFTASQQYIAIAVHFDGADLPQLAARFYAQADEERGHAMMMIQYLLDNDLEVRVPGVDDVVNAFGSVREPVELALRQEKKVTEQITTLARTARDTGDYLGEQFMQWFLAEQIEEVASMTTLLTIVDRAGENLFHIEDFIAREMTSESRGGGNAPRAAGGLA